MKIFFLTLALLMAGLAFVAPPLIAFLPALLVGLLLMASPLMMRGMAHGGRTRDDDSAVRRGQGPTSGTTAR
jgi:hypothetical protein